MDYAIECSCFNARIKRVKNKTETFGNVSVDREKLCINVSKQNHLRGLYLVEKNFFVKNSKNAIETMIPQVNDNRR